MDLVTFWALLFACVEVFVFFLGRLGRQLDLRHVSSFKTFIHGLLSENENKWSARSLGRPWTPLDAS